MRHVELRRKGKPADTGKPATGLKLSTKAFMWSFLVSAIILPFLDTSSPVMPWAIAVSALSAFVLVCKAGISMMDDSERRFEAELDAAGMTEAEKINARQLRRIKHNTEATALGTWTR